MLLPPPGHRRLHGDEPAPARRASSKPPPKTALVRSSPRDLPAERAVTKVEEAAFATVEAEVGGRPALIELLAVVARTEKEDALLAALADPLNDRRSLAVLCAGQKLDRAALYEKLKASTLARAQTRATLKVAERLPAVAAGVMEDSVSGPRPCRPCAGLGKIAGKPTPDGPPEEIDCSACRGTGIVYFTPETEVRKMALQLGRLIDRPGGGPNISILQANANVGGMIQADTYDRLVGALDGVLYGAGRDRLSKVQTSDIDGAVDGEITGEITGEGRE